MKPLIIVFLIINFFNAYGNESFNLIAKNCQGHTYDICYETINDYRMSNENKNIKWKLIEKQYKNLCNSSYAKACRALGNLYAPNNIDAIKVNWENSGKYHTKGCLLGDMVSCNNLGAMYKYGKFYKKDYKKALELFTKACEDKDHAAVDKACSSKERLLELMKDL